MNKKYYEELRKLYAVMDPNEESHVEEMLYAHDLLMFFCKICRTKGVLDMEAAAEKLNDSVIETIVFVSIVIGTAPLYNIDSILFYLGQIQPIS